MQQRSKRTTPRGNKLKNIEKGRQRAGGLLTPLSLSGGSQITIVSSWRQVGDQKEDDTSCLYASHKVNVILVWTLKNALKGEFWASGKNARRSQGESSNTSNTHQKHSQQLSSRVVGLLHLFLSRLGCLSFGWKINSHWNSGYVIQ